MTHPPTNTTPSALPDFVNQLPDEVRSAALACARMCAYCAGETVCEQGASADAIYFVVSGAVHCMQFGELIPLGVGESFGEREVLRATSYEATLLASSDAQFWVLGKSPLDALLEKYGALGLALARHIGRKLEQEQQRSPPVALPTHRAVGSNRYLSPTVVGALLIATVASIGVGALTLLFWVTLNVRGMEVTSPQSLSSRVEDPRGEVEGKASSVAPKVAQAVMIFEPLPTLNPGKTTHAVVAGDTLSSIALMHCTNPAVVRTLNGLDSDLIRIGDQVAVPGGEVVLVPTRPSPFSGLRPPPTRVSQRTMTPVPSPATITPVVLQPTVPSMPAALAVLPPSPPPRQWEMPAWTSVEEASVLPGQQYYRLVKAIYFDEASAGGRVNIFIGVLDEDGKPLTEIPVRMEWGAGEYTIRTTGDKFDYFLQPYKLNAVAVHDMASGSSFSPDRGERGGYKIVVQGLPSGAVSGMGLPLRRHVAFLLVFQRTVK